MKKKLFVVTGVVVVVVVAVTILLMNFCSLNKNEISTYRENVVSNEFISASFDVAVIKEDGTVEISSVGNFYDCDVTDWENIVEVSAGNDHVVGLKEDGTVIASGDNEYGKCDVQAWDDIVAVCAGYRNTLGIKDDGSVVAAGGIFLQEDIKTILNCMDLSHS